MLIPEPKFTPGIPVVRRSSMLRNSKNLWEVDEKERQTSIMIIWDAVYSFTDGFWIYQTRTAADTSFVNWREEELVSLEEFRVALAIEKAAMKDT